MISRPTIYSLLVTLLLAAGIAAWSAEHRDECSAYLAGDTRAPSDEVVQTGTHAVQVQCDVWFARQPRVVQTLCLVVAGGGVVFLISACGDWKGSRD